jgi:adenosylcobyric acid synthase
MTETILVAGTASHVGKSTIATGICRLLSEQGYAVAPFKAQNMSNNARATPDGEIGVSQYVQARAADVPPASDHNPVLLKPRGDGQSQIVIDGEAVEHIPASQYYDTHWDRAREAAATAHERLAANHEVIIAEGAGSIAEINLHDRDLANIEAARFAEADILLVADIERGGVFASLVGTLELVPDDIRDRVAGTVITKFRGDRSLLDSGIEAFEDRTGVPILGIIPYDDPGLPEEDSVALPAAGERAVHGDDDGVPDDRAITIAVPRLPQISNFTDLQPIAAEPGVRVAYIPITHSLADADAVVIPGTKNTVDDLLALRDAGFDDELTSFQGPIVGLCGGYQILGEEIRNAAVEGTGTDDRIAGIGLLPITTRFSTEKTVERVERRLDGVGPLSGVNGTVSGYEIHMGDSTVVGEASRPFPDSGAATDRVLGTYLHDLFANDKVKNTFVDTVFENAGIDRPERTTADRVPPIGRAAALVREHVTADPLPVAW